MTNPIIPNSYRGKIRIGLKTKGLFVLISYFPQTFYGHFKKLPCFSGEMTFVLLNDIAGELLPYGIDAGFRPGSRGPFGSAKGPKTIDAPPGHIRLGGRKPREGGPTRCAQTSPAEG